MDNSDSMFLFEMFVEELFSYIHCKNFYITSQFADIFSLNLKDPNDIDPLKPKVIKPKKKQVREARASANKSKDDKHTTQSILFTSRINVLMVMMKNFPIILNLYDTDKSGKILGSSHIPWSPVYVDYLYKLLTRADTSPPELSSRYNIYDESTSNRMATIRLNTKLTHVKNRVISYHSLSELNHNKYFMQSELKHNVERLKNTSTNNLNTEKNSVEDSSTDVKRAPKISNQSKKKRQTSHRLIKIEEHKEIKLTDKPKKEIKVAEAFNPENKNLQHKNENQLNMLNIIKSESNFDRNKQKEDIKILKTNSCTTMYRKSLNILNYVFGNDNAHFGNPVLCVSYFTVENDFNKDTNSSETSSRKGDSKPETPGSTEDTSTKEKIQFKLCSNDCPAENSDAISIDVNKEVADLTTVKKCNMLGCDEREHRVVPVTDDAIRMDIETSECCKQTIEEEIIGGVRANMKINKDQCFCSCECTFGFVKRTTYCGICGGYEMPGEDMPKKQLTAPFPCPIYHKTDQNLKKPLEAAADKKNRCEEILQRSKRAGSKSSGKSVSSAKSGITNVESERGKKKPPYESPMDKFEYNYGYTAPQIGHSQCALPCTGTLGAVPKNMGWLWTADNVPGLKFRPNWKPGAVHKHVLHLLHMAKHPGIILSKKKRRDAGKKKKPLKRPLLTVAKKDGEYTVTMETMKMYPKARALNQQPYEDKPLLTYTIGRTEEENRERQKKREREKRRLQRDQREFIQSTFTDMCKEICLKTYQQALGILPETEIPDCPCYPQLPGPEDTNLDRSCSCSDDENVSMGSDTDDDEWVVEFTPPNALFDPTFQGKRVLKSENETQFTHLDYKVKLNDRYGNPVPRFFKGPDGSQQCSDLGGFWSPDHKWLEINVDGYIAPDNRWAPLMFHLPSGEQIDCDTGRFIVENQNYVVGVDGYVDVNGIWKSYGRDTFPKNNVYTSKGAGDKGRASPYNRVSEGTWSCFGDVNAKDLSRMGILGHGVDRKHLLQTLKAMVAQGDDVKIPQIPAIPRVSERQRNKEKIRMANLVKEEDRKCHHAVPSSKGIIAVDDHGNKTYFRLKDYDNMRSKQRITHLTKQGISLSSFHVPCFSSFINREVMKQQLYDKRFNDQKNRSDGTKHPDEYYNVIV